MDFKKVRHFIFFVLYSLFLQIGMFIFLFHFYYQPQYIQENNIIKIHENCTIVNETQLILDKVQNISDYVAWHDYVKYKYDCSEFSKNLTLSLKKEMNFTAFCVFGTYRCLERPHTFALHTWSAFILENKTYFIESTGGVFISEEEYKRCYHEISRGICA